MLLLIIRVIFACVCIGSIVTYVSTTQGPKDMRPLIIQQHPFFSFVVMMLITQVATFGDLLLKKKRIEIISPVYFGLMIGYLLTHLFMLAIENNLQESFREPVQMLAALILPYLCISLLLQTKDDFRFVIPYVEFSRELKGGKPLILDSSALIDGRIADVMDTKIIDAQLVVPQFVLHEIQDIADSNDKMRRTRGRRGLDVLSKLQNSPNAEVRMHDAPDRAGDHLSVDQRLVRLAKELGGRVVTNDFNLNKVASVQGVDVVNLNDVANSLKPRYLPGERVQIRIMKEGESAGQGVGYLDDGTMVVCEQAQHLVGKEIDVIVTSMLQSSAGRMIFGRQVHQASNS
jgi:uncharacterized protein YacL